jgi:adenosylmethionine-8-amino-7-oxononanoate aminotransferase
MNTHTRREIIRKDREHAWHPFTQMGEWREREPIVITKGKGNYIYDARGKKYFDGVSSLWCNVHGHRVRAIDRAVKKQLKDIAHTTFLGLTHPLAAQLSERLAAISPEGLNKVFYSDSGSEAVEIAVKMAYQYWQLKGAHKKTRFISFTNAYHGDTIGSVSIGGIGAFHSRFSPLLFDAEFAPPFYSYPESKIEGTDAYAEKSLAAIEEKLASSPDEYAAIVIEPFSHAAGGILVYPEFAYRRLREISRKYNTLLIADEVAVGFGRTGAMFASEKAGVTPDFLCTAKGITGGYLPLAATICTDEIFNAFVGTFEEQKTFYHGHTYTANPLACAAALASLSLFEKNRVLENLAPRIEQLRTRLEKIAALPHVGDVRQTGMMAGIEIVRDKETHTPYEAGLRMGVKACEAAIARGIWLRPLGDVVVLMPPLSITRREVDTLADVVEEAIASVCEKA